MRSFALSLLLVLAATAGCGGTVAVLPAYEVALPEICFQDPDAATRSTPFVADGNAATLTLTGTVTSVDHAVDPTTRSWTGTCADHPKVLGTVFALDDGAGTTWTFGLALLRHDGTDHSPALALAPGQTVTVGYAQDFAHAGDHALQVTDAEGTVLAVDDLRGVLQSGRLHGFTVTRGDFTGPVASGDCGETRATTTRFKGDTTATLAPGDTGTFRAAGHTLHAFASWSWVERAGWRCSDVVRPLAYFVWR